MGGINQASETWKPLAPGERKLPTEFISQFNGGSCSYMSAGSGVPLIRSQPKEEATPASWQPRLTHRPKKMQQETRDHSSIHPSIPSQTRQQNSSVHTQPIWQFSLQDGNPGISITA
jgi:hypothetical protein